jgi:hypothetical protein
MLWVSVSETAQRGVACRQAGMCFTDAGVKMVNHKVRLLGLEMRLYHRHLRGADGSDSSNVFRLQCMS